MTYIVKHLNNGDVGVYDTERACFPNEGPELRAAGIKRIDWMQGKGAQAEAERIAAILNEFHGHIEHATNALKAMGASAEQVDESMQRLADALLADAEVGA